MTNIRKSDASTTGGWFPRKRRQRRELVQNALATSSTSVGKKTLASTSLTRSETASQNKAELSQPRKKRNSAIPTGSKKDSATDISVMPGSEAMPLWLLRLSVCQRNTSIVTFICVAATLLVYGWSVYSQQLWSQSYQKLQNLQRQERQLTVTNGVLKSKMAADAEKNNNGLTSITPQRTIFLTPTPGNQNQLPQNLPPDPQVQSPNSTSPGY
ncbi:hypothetical protein [Calothrix sp. PCC 6303]|uniref:hypothetical protein n=1 Tax=Calothrix sp. PCC 6303 TaxID=1170562 RepID=UPI0002A0344E|nr:hypothetical protein [Calothrix sp. PCC 6303]AFZ04221.1 hypothetical protein Cal6303_5338 [Calothrix sp. PCC 6303]